MFDDPTGRCGSGPGRPRATMVAARQPGDTAASRPGYPY